MVNIADIIYKIVNKIEEHFESHRVPSSEKEESSLSQNVSISSTLFNI
jgi:hypothetical protein